MTAPALTFRGRLPGVDCQPALPAAGQPIRLDVAAFVGFAERGPLNLPVAVEDANQYAVVFGGDLPVAADGGLPVYANLPSAVRAFFDNGGRRCYVVRVAGEHARAARLQVPGLRQATGEFVYVEAAWPGTWSAGLQVGTQLLETPIAIAGPYLAGTLTLAPGQSAIGIGGGDLLRLDIGPSVPAGYVRVDSVAGPELTLTPLTDMPDQALVAAAWLERFDLTVRQHTETSDRQLERWPDLRFNGPRDWRGVLQPAGDDTPELTRSLTLRADSSGVTTAFLPHEMDQTGSAAEFTDPSGASLPAADAGDDDLASFDPVALFLDADLASDTIYDVLADAASLTVLATEPRALRGIHALVDLDEVALIAVPDAVHRNWTLAPPAPPEPPQPPPLPPPVPVDLSRFHCCDDETQPPAGDTAAGDTQPSPQADPLAGLPLLDEVARYDPAGLIAVQTALTELCAARSDAVAILSLPAHYDSAAARDWHQAITTQSRLSTSGAAAPPLSFAGYWHPWPQIIEPATPALAPLRPVPPDGHICGMIAARELARGGWVAPAHQPLRGPAALTPPIAAGDLPSLFDAHANLLVHEPGMFTTLSAHTLADDPAQLQISLRRLLILLRKIALQQGQRYVFEVNNDRFRQLVRMRFTRILGTLAQRGAFLAYQVVTDGGVNTAADMDNGRLIVSLQVAPSSPVEFITVSLVRSGEGLLDVLEG
jgi:Bacteriophage tail sheath protein